MPGFVEQEFRDFLRFGLFGGGFARFRLVIDGVLTQAGEEVRFHPCPWLDAADVDEVLTMVKPYV